VLTKIVLTNRYTMKNDPQNTVCLFAVPNRTNLIVVDESAGTNQLEATNAIPSWKAGGQIQSALTAVYSRVSMS
jgi:hypothetical protein